ncbi:MAG: PAS domain-containing protein [Armatimonadetes bacterium]|nr:PAS domain-containing protein [Armatimonadota bacterium]
MAKTRTHILVVDDEPGILQCLEDLLEDEYVVHTTTHPDTALELIEKHEIAVLVSDQRMPGFSGDELLARAAELSAATRVLLTGYADLEAVIRAVNRGHIYAYVSKPWKPAELQLTLARAAEHYYLVKQLRTEQALLNQLLASTPDVIYFKDNNCRFTRVNQAKAGLVGIKDPAELVGRGDWDFFPRDQAERIQQEDRTVLEERMPLLDKVEAYTPPDGRVRWFSTTKVPLRGDGGKVEGLVGISRDITSRKQAEKELEEAQLRLVQAEAERKAFCREVLLAVTEGQFHLVDPDELPKRSDPLLDVDLREPENYALLRQELVRIAAQQGLSEEQAHDLVLAAGEAATNAIKHACEGRCSVHLEDSRVIVRVADRGAGIRPENLPATLFRAGFSTKVSLGLGYRLILSLVDTIWLATGPKGTVIQLEKAAQADNNQEEELLSALLDRFSA